MGWLFTRDQSKADLVQRRIRSEENDTTRWTCLAHSVRGNTLWTVWEVVDKPTGNVRKRLIGCDLLRSQRDYGWGYKDMSEAMGPYCYTCPVKFLDMVPMDLYPGSVNWEWRAELFVRLRNKKEQNKTGKAVAVGKLVTLKNTCNPRTFVITDIYKGGRRANRTRIEGRADNGRIYTIPKRWIEQVEDAPTLATATA